MTTVLIHPFSSLLSAYGMGLADIRAVRQRAIEEPLPDNSFEHELEKRLVPIVEDLAREARDELLRQDVPPDDIRFAIKVHARYSGTDTALIYDGGWSGSDADYTARVKHFEELSAKYKPSQTYQDFPPALPLRMDGHIFGYLQEADSIRLWFHAHHRQRFGFRDPKRQGDSGSHLGRSDRWRSEIHRGGARDHKRCIAGAGATDAFLFQRELA